MFSCLVPGSANASAWSGWIHDAHLSVSQHRTVKVFDAWNAMFPPDWIRQIAETPRLIKQKRKIDPRSHPLDPRPELRRPGLPIPRRDHAGLGLSVCRQLIESMNGTLTVHSVHCSGTRMKVRLPLHQGVTAHPANRSLIEPIPVLIP